jgi:hypothetical protein
MWLLTHRCRSFSDDWDTHASADIRQLFLDPKASKAMVKDAYLRDPGERRAHSLPRAISEAERAAQRPEHGAMRATLRAMSVGFSDQQYSDTPCSTFTVYSPRYREEPLT